jgi:hypothetical protein
VGRSNEQASSSRDRLPFPLRLPFLPSCTCILTSVLVIIYQPLTSPLLRNNAAKHPQPRPAQPLPLSSISIPDTRNNALTTFLTSPPPDCAPRSFPLPHSKASAVSLPPNRPRCSRSAAAAGTKLWIDPRPPVALPRRLHSLRRHRPSSDRPAAAAAPLLPTASVALAAAPGVRALHYSLRQSQPDTDKLVLPVAAAAPLPPKRRLYSSR